MGRFVSEGGSDWFNREMRKRMGEVMEWHLKQIILEGDGMGKRHKKSKKSQPETTTTTFTGGQTLNGKPFFTLKEASLGVRVPDSDGNYVRVKLPQTVRLRLAVPERKLSALEQAVNPEPRLKYWERSFNFGPNGCVMWYRLRLEYLVPCEECGFGIRHRVEYKADSEGIHQTPYVHPHRPQRWPNGAWAELVGMADDYDQRVKAYILQNEVRYEPE